MKKQLKKSKAFTLIEITVTLFILGVFMTVIYSYIFKNNEIDAKKLNAQSRSFYDQVSNTVLQIAHYDAQGKGIKSLSADDLAKLFARHIADINISSAEDEMLCTSFVIKALPEEAVQEGEDISSAEDSEEEDSADAYNPALSENARCFETKHGLLVALDVDNSCSTTVYAKEYSSDDLSVREVAGVCGFVAYEPKGAAGTLGEDLFVIPLGNMRVR